MTKLPRNRLVWINSGWQPIGIGFCPSAKAWRRTMKELNGSSPWPARPNGGGHCELLVNDKSGRAVILVTVMPDAERAAIEVITTIVHEAVHVWQFLCQEIGEKAPGIELEAYAIEEISRGLIDAYSRTQGRGRKWL